MNSKWYPYLLLLALVVILIIVKRCNRENGDPATTSETRASASTRKSSNNPAPDRNRGFDRRVSYIDYTQHAKCRMKCRHISQKEVEAVMRAGKINYNKSKVSASPCPEYTLEGVTADNQEVRIVFAQCDLKTKVVTVIDLKTEWTCDCPGDR